MGQNQHKNDVIIGIDFGSSGVSFSYGFLNNQRTVPIQGFFDGQFSNNKLSTEIILDDNLNILAFGNDCEGFLSSIKDKNFHHFKNIKMNLYKKKYKIKSRNSDKEVDIQFIIQLILQEIKKKALEQIKRTMPQLQDNNIHWIITVPAIWEIKSKQIMINAAQEAGLIRDDDDPSNFFALEPEAASLYYHNSTQAQINNIELGEPFIVCDFGGGTVDIVTQKKVKNNNQFSKFEEVYRPLGGHDGCNLINEYFMDRVIKELFGEQCFNETKNNKNMKNYNNWIELENKIEEKKKKFYKFEQVNEYFQIDCFIFKTNCKKKNLNDLVENFNSKNKNWKLKIDEDFKILFPYQIFYDFMLEIINKMSEYIYEIMNSIKNVKSLIFTGGASANPIFQQMLQNIEELRNINIVSSQNPEFAISNGSVYFSYDHNIISPRKSKYSFGIKVRENWNDKKHRNGGIKICDKIDQKDKCENLFSKFITINDNIRPDREIIKSYLMCDSNVMVELYKTKENNVTFINEVDNNGNLKIEKFGEFNIDVGNDFDVKNKNVEVRIKMGGTFISCSATYCKTKKKAKMTCLFE